MAATFLEKHPFIKRLMQRVITIFVSWTAVVICLFGTFFAFGIFFAIMAFSAAPAEEYDSPLYSNVYGDDLSSNQLLSVKVTGMIVGSEEDAWGDATAGYAVKEKLQVAAEDDTISGIVLEINSPGGTIYGSQAIADGVTYYQEKTGKPVYAFVEGQAASGGYWAAAPADKIIADFGSDVGSIGVIMGPFQYYNKLIAEDGGLLTGGVITQNGIESNYITAGKSKDVGSPYRKLTEAELALLQQSVNNEYANFVAYVSKHRDIPAETLRETIGTMAYDNKTAISYKLIDHTGSRDAAYTELAKAAGVEDDFQVIREDPPFSFLTSLLQAAHLKPKKEAVKPELCKFTRASLAYHGDVGQLCKAD